MALPVQAFNVPADAVMESFYSSLKNSTRPHLQNRTRAAAYYLG